MTAQRQAPRHLEAELRTVHPRLGYQWHSDDERWWVHFYKDPFFVCELEAGAPLAPCTALTVHAARQLNYKINHQRIMWDYVHALREQGRKDSRINTALMRESVREQGRALLRRYDAQLGARNWDRATFGDELAANPRLKAEYDKMRGYSE